MRDKFQIEFTTLDDPSFAARARPRGAVRASDASIHTAKTHKHSEAIRRVAYDLIIVDEAHHLRTVAALRGSSSISSRASTCCS